MSRKKCRRANSHRTDNSVPRKGEIRVWHLTLDTAQELAPVSRKEIDFNPDCAVGNVTRVEKH